MVSDAERLGRAVLELITDDGSFNKGVDRAEAKAGGLAKTFGTVAKAGVAAFAAAAAGLAVLVKQQINAADTLTKLSQGAGIGVQAFSALDHVARLSSVSTETLSTSINKLNRNMVESAAGTGESREAFRALGIEVKNVDGSLKTSEQVMAEVADKFAGMEDGAGKSALAMAIFGRSGAQLIPMLNQGSAGMDKLREEARRLGVTIDAETGQAAERFNDNLTRLNAVKRGLVNEVMKALLPTLNNLTDSLVNTARESGALERAAKAAAVGLKILLTGGTLLFSLLKAIGERLGAVAASLVALAQGQFRRAWEIQKQSVHDFLETVKGAHSTIVSIWDETERGAAASAQRMQTIAKAAAPLLGPTKEQLAEAKRAEEAWLQILANSAMKRLQIQEEAERQADEQAKRAEEAWLQMIANSEMKRLAIQDEAERQAEARLQQKQAALTREVEQIRVSLLTQEQLEREAHARRLAALLEANDMRLLTDAQMMDMREAMEQAHAERLEEIRRREREQQSSGTQAAWSELLGAFGQFSSDMFRVSQIASAGQAFVAALAGAAEALKLPFPANLAASALVLARGLGLVASIKGAKLSGGMPMPSASRSSGVGATAPQPAQQPDPKAEQPGDRVTLIKMQGKFFDDETVRRLLAKVGDVSRDGGRVVVV